MRERGQASLGDTFGEVEEDRPERRDETPRDDAREEDAPQVPETPAPSQRPTADEDEGATEGDEEQPDEQADDEDRNVARPEDLRERETVEETTRSRSSNRRGPAGPWECPACGEDSEKCYRCSECGKDLVAAGSGSQ